MIQDHFGEMAGHGMLTLWIRGWEAMTSDMSSKGRERLGWVLIIAAFCFVSLIGQQIGLWGGDDPQGGGGGSGQYSGTFHQDSNGNDVPDDCYAWAGSSSNPLNYSDGLALCQGYG
jgi:hypothetical protein